MSADLKSYVEKYLLNPGASFTADDEESQETRAVVVGSVGAEEGAGQVGGVSKLRARSAAAAQQAEGAARDPRYQGRKVLRRNLQKLQEVEYDPELTKYFLLEGSEGEEEEEGGEDDSGDDGADSGDGDSGENEGEEKESGHDSGEDEGEESEAVSGDEEGEEVEGDDSEVEEVSGHDSGEDEGEESEDVSGDEEGEEVEGDDSEVEVNEDDLRKKVKPQQHRKKMKKKEDSEEEEEEEETAAIKKLHQQLLQEQKGVTFVDDGDFSKFADDFDEDDSGEDDEDDSGEDEEEEGTQDQEEEEQEEMQSGFKKFSIEDQSEEVEKSRAVRNQLAIYDSLFEGRIALQKVMVGSNQLPQHTYKLFLRQNDPNYRQNLHTAATATRKLLDAILHAQELMLRQNPDTKHVLVGKKSTTHSDEEEPGGSGSEGEGVDQGESGGGKKRKRSLEEYNQLLNKRHAAFIPFRDSAINKWYEKTKLLRSGRGGGGGVEVSALQQLHNLLANKTQLVQRSQLTGTTRGATYHVLGTPQVPTTTPLPAEQYDPEVYEDGDFYGRQLEEVLKAKVSGSLTDVSRRYVEIQNLRRKAKRVVDTKASKGRKLRYQVMSKLQQYLAPCCPPTMDDAAINTLFASLFGKALRKAQAGTTSS